MGYDLTRFVCKIDDEFRCLICWMVFENPVETPCGHAFCNECIIRWFSASVTCPIDRTPLLQSDLKTPGRLFSNVLAKLEINCNFGKQETIKYIELKFDRFWFSISGAEGCKMVVELGHLQHHLAICEFNPNSETTCDKGCNRKLPRRKHQTHSCLTHLLYENERIQLIAVHHEKQNTKLKQIVLEQSQEIQRLEEKIENLISHQNIQIRELWNFKMKTLRQEEQITTLKKALEHLEVNSKMRCPKWTIDKNLCLSEKSNIFECMSDWSEAQSNNSLSPQSSYFEVELLNTPIDARVFIGLGPKDLCFSNRENIWLNNAGYLRYFEKDDFAQVEYGVGDVIECGIKYPQNFNGIQSQEVVVYFSKNGNLVHEHRRILSSRLFPKIYLYKIGTKVKVNHNMTI